MSRSLDGINSVLGSGAVLFLFFSGVALFFMTCGSAVFKAVKNGRVKRSGDGSKENVTCNRAGKRRHSPFGSLCLALAGTLGVGNISGVAAAIAFGGAGAVFWMWVSALFCSALKYAEVVLAIRYRERNSSGEFVGGAHIYMEQGLGARRLGMIFCGLCVFSSFTTGNITQINAAAQALELSFGVSPWICGAVCLVLLLILCRSGSAIYSFTLKIIPFLCLGYIVLSLCVILPNGERIPEVTQLILDSAFTPRAGIGGIMGILCGKAVRIGITRGVMSNEAGCGTAPIAHAAAETESPSLQGGLGVVEVLFDTLILCTLTAYAILLSGGEVNTEMSTVTAISAFAAVLGEWVSVPLALAMFLFALASAAGWNYYGRVSLSHLGAKRSALLAYAFSYSVCAFFGAVSPEGVLWQLSDLSIYLMAIMNTVCVLLLFGRHRAK